MRVKKRDGSYQPVDFGKISDRLGYLVEGYDPNGQLIGEKLSIDPIEIAKTVCSFLKDGITSSQLDEFAAELCAFKVGEHYHYDLLASRIIISNHHKNTEEHKNFSDMMTALYENKDFQGLSAPLISESFYKSVMNNKELLDNVVNNNHHKDYEYLDYFGFKTLEKSYLLKIKTGTHQIQERYQHLLMRVAFNMYQNCVEKAINCYELMCQGLFTHATPTLFNSGTSHPQMSSCFLAGMDDSIDGMYECIRRLSHISKWSGGIGVHLHNVRSRGSMIRGTNGESSGLVPLIKVINDVAKHVNQGGKRKGSIALYIEPWHADILEFLDLKKNQGSEEMRARDLFYGLWIPDLFMILVKKALTMKMMTGKHNIKWNLMCPDECPGLSDCYGDKFNELYMLYESQGKYRKQVDILVLWQAILDAQKETGVPYMCYKDHVNNKSNQKNVGTIRSSNLCSEIMEYSSSEEYAVCNLASINLQKMVKKRKNETTGQITNIFDFELLHDVTKIVTENLNQIIDINYYPVPQTKTSNFKHRPIGIGVQGLADAFILMNLPFESIEAQKLNKEIFETIYHAALEKSSELSQKRYEELKIVPSETLNQLKEMSSYISYYENHFLSQQLNNRKNLTIAEEKINETYRKQYENYLSKVLEIINKYNINTQIFEYQYMNLEIPNYMGSYSTFTGSPAHQGQLQHDLWGINPSDRWNFKTLKDQIKQFGLRNSLLVAVMPTATTASILGSTECIEPISSLIHSRQTLSGTFLVVNKHLQKILTEIGLWGKEIKDEILLKGGSIQQIESIPKHYREIFKTGWEMSKKILVDMSADRGPWIDQSQSFNLFISDPNDDILSSVHIHAWEKGLKTGMYYLRRQTIVIPQQFSIDIDKNDKKSKEKSVKLCSIKDPECTSCGT